METPQNKITIPPELWVELYSCIASYILNEVSLDNFEMEKDENGDLRYPEDKELEFESYCEYVEEILEGFFIKGEK